MKDGSGKTTGPERGDRFWRLRRRAAGPSVLEVACCILSEELKLCTTADFVYVDSKLKTDNNHYNRQSFWLPLYFLNNDLTARFDDLWFPCCRQRACGRRANSCTRLSGKQTKNNENSSALRKAGSFEGTLSRCFFMRRIPGVLVCPIFLPSYYAEYAECSGSGDSSECSV